MAWTLGGWSSPERCGRWGQYSGRVEAGKMTKHFPRWLRWKRCLILWANNSPLFTMILRCQKRSFWKRTPCTFLFGFQTFQTSNHQTLPKADFQILHKDSNDYEFGKFRESSNPGWVEYINPPDWLLYGGVSIEWIFTYRTYPEVLGYVYTSIESIPFLKIDSTDRDWFLVDISTTMRFWKT